ncbi:hypothetical protein [Methylocaldum sp.]|uniref:hypothetical protein n=1 Tax=Methylocaldum sp. TaxID=1969727 RepID=UPI00321F724A
MHSFPSSKLVNPSSKLVKCLTGGVYSRSSGRKLKARSLQASSAITGVLLSAMMWVTPAVAEYEGYCERVIQLRKIEKDLEIVRVELVKNNATIADMQRILDASFKGGPPPDENKLQAMGIAGRGVVGAGKSKAEQLQAIIKKYESPVRLTNVVDALALQAMKIGEVERALTEQAKKSGVESVTQLSEEDKKAAIKMGQGRAVYQLEIKRNREYGDSLLRLYAEINAKRMALFNELGPLERENYDEGACTEGATTGNDSSGDESGDGRTDSEDTGAAEDPNGGGETGGPTGSRSDSGGPGSGLGCPIQQLGYSPDAIFVPTADSSQCGPCPPLAGWSVPGNARCGGASPTGGAGTPRCPPDQHWSKDLGKCHAGS